MKPSPRNVRFARLLPLAILLLAGLAAIQPAQAAPTFDSPQTIGLVNMDNNYAVTRASNAADTVIIAHTVDTSGTLVVDISTDNGATTTTKPVQIGGASVADFASGFNRLSVAAIDASKIMIIRGYSNPNIRAVYTTNGGDTWTSVNVIVPGTPEAMRAHSLAAVGTRYLMSYEYCGLASCQGSGGSAALNYGLSYSDSSGATWTGTASLGAYGLTGTGTFFSRAGHAIYATSTSAWGVYYVRPTCGTPSSCGAASAGKLSLATTTNSGAAYTITDVNDAFAPYSDFGSYVSTSPDGNSVSFTNAAVTNLIHGAKQPSGAFYFTTFATTAFNPITATIHCNSKDVVVAQVLNGGERINYYEISGQAATTTAITGTTSATVYPFDAFLVGADVSVAYGDLSNGKTLVKSTTNGDCAQAVAPADDSIPIANSATVTGLVGFDVDPAGVTAIARTDLGEYVRVYPAGTLAGPSSKDTDCLTGVLEGGVAAQSSHVAYFDCDGGGDVVQVEIRSPSLGSPNRPPVCNDAGFCVEDIETECGVFTGCIEGDQDDDERMAIVEELPIDYSNNQNGPVDEDSVFIGMAFTDTSGKLGVWTYVMRNNGEDTSDVVSVGIANQAADQICSHRDPNGATYLYGSSYTSNVRGFRVGFSFQGVLSDDTVVPSMTSVFPGSASTAGPAGVSCGDYRLAILNNDKLTIWARNANGQSSAPLLTQTLVEEPPLSGVATSYNGEYTAYASGAKWYVIYSGTNTTAVDGEILCEGDMPTGTFQDMKMHGAGSSLWIATSTTIARYDTFDCTTGDDTVFNPVEDPGDLDGDGVDNEDDPDIDGDGLPNDIDTDDDGDGIPDEIDNSPGGPGSSTVGGGGLIPEGGLFGAISGTLFMAFLLIFGVVWMGVRQGAPGVAIGALFFIGLGLAYAIGWMPVWMIVVLTLLSVGASFLIPKADNASGGLA